MLILTRRKNEKIIIGDNLISIMIVEVNDHSVRLGIDAPKDLSVHREEIYNRIKEEGDK